MAVSIYTTRRDNIRTLIRQWGGPGSLAKKLATKVCAAIITVLLTTIGYALMF